MAIVGRQTCASERALCVPSGPEEGFFPFFFFFLLMLHHQRSAVKCKPGTSPIQPVEMVAIESLEARQRAAVVEKGDGSNPTTRWVNWTSGDGKELDLKGSVREIPSLMIGWGQRALLHHYMKSPQDDRAFLVRTEYSRAAAGAPPWWHLGGQCHRDRDAGNNQEGRGLVSVQFVF